MPNLGPTMNCYVSGVASEYPFLRSSLVSKTDLPCALASNSSNFKLCPKSRCPHRFLVYIAHVVPGPVMNFDVLSWSPFSLLYFALPAYLSPSWIIFSRVFFALFPSLVFSSSLCRCCDIITYRMDLFSTMILSAHLQQHIYCRLPIISSASMAPGVRIWKGEVM